EFVDDCRRCWLTMIKDVIATARRFRQLTWLTVLLHSAAFRRRAGKRKEPAIRAQIARYFEVRFVADVCTESTLTFRNFLLELQSKAYTVREINCATNFSIITTIPSYIHVCGRNDPNYNQCVVDNINNIKNKICTGMPELNVVPMEPINIDEIVIYNTDNLKLSIKESKTSGFCDFVINSSKIFPDKFHFDIDFVFKHLDMDARYDVDMRILVPLTNKGLIHISTVKTIFNIKTFKYKFDDSEKDLVQLHEALTNIVTENEKDIISKVKPVIEEAISKLIITVFNKVVRNRFEQLFPNEA
ncbi:hypothetical protein ALC60_08297, partial [Trachymyrmex zeteki]